MAHMPSNFNCHYLRVLEFYFFTELMLKSKISAGNISVVELLSIMHETLDLNYNKKIP